MSILDIEQNTDMNDLTKEVVKKFLNDNYMVKNPIWGLTLNKAGADLFEFIMEDDGMFTVNGRDCNVILKSEAQTITNDLFRWGEVDEFECSRNKHLIDLTGSPRKVFVFQCSGCSNLTSLRGGPEEAVKFVCAKCPNLKTLEYLPKNVKKIFCEFSGIETIDDIPDGCVEVRIDGCRQVKSIYNLPSSVKVLDMECCDYITDLKTNANLTWLNIGHSGVTNLNNLPRTLKSLICLGCDKLENVDSLKGILGNMELFEYESESGAHIKTFKTWVADFPIFQVTKYSAIYYKRNYIGSD